MVAAKVKGFPHYTSEGEARISMSYIYYIFFKALLLIVEDHGCMT